jgi:hypothetical protein
MTWICQIKHPQAIAKRFAS